MKRHPTIFGIPAEEAEEGQDGDAGAEKPTSRVGTGTRTGEHPGKTSTSQGREQDAQEDGATRAGTGSREAGAEEEERDPCERQAIGGGNNPPDGPRNQASQATDGDSGDVGFVSMEPEKAPEETPEEGAGEDGSKPEPQGYLQLDGVGTTKQSNTIGRWTGLPASEGPASPQWGRDLCCT